MRMATTPGWLIPSTAPTIRAPRERRSSFSQAVGADTLQLNFIQLYPFAEPETGILDTPAVYPFNGPGYGIVYVTKQGKRFVNELERRDVCAFAQINLGKDAKPTWSIFSDAMVLKMGGSKEEVAAGIAKGRFIKADSIADLASKIKIPADVLVDTITKHNQYIAEGKDPDFGKAITKVMIPMVDGPFYATPQWPAIHHCMGGVRINPQAQVIDVFNKVIPTFTVPVNGRAVFTVRTAWEAMLSRIASFSAVLPESTRRKKNPLPK